TRRLAARRLECRCHIPRQRARLCDRSVRLLTSVPARGTRLDLPVQPLARLLRGNAEGALDDEPQADHTQQFARRAERMPHDEGVAVNGGRPYEPDAERERESAAQ